MLLVQVLPLLRLLLQSLVKVTRVTVISYNTHVRTMLKGVFATAIGKVPVRRRTLLKPKLVSLPQHVWVPEVLQYFCLKVSSLSFLFCRVFNVDSLENELRIVPTLVFIFSNQVGVPV